MKDLEWATLTYWGISVKWNKGKDLDCTMKELLDKLNHIRYEIIKIDSFLYCQMGKLIHDIVTNQEICNELELDMQEGLNEYKN